MPGELKNLVALAISSGTSKYNHHREKKPTPPRARRRSGADKKHVQNRATKEETSSGAKRLTKLLSKSVGAVSSSITHTRLAAPQPPLPAAAEIKKAPVASPESDGSSLLNGEFCGIPIEEPVCSADSNHHDIDESRSPCTRLKNRSSIKPWSTMNGSAINSNGPRKDRDECSGDETWDENWRSIISIRHRYSTDVSRGAETDDETILSSAVGLSRSAEKETMNEIPTTSAMPTTSTRNGQDDVQSKCCFGTRKPYRSVAYKTWTVGAARRLLNSRSDYDLSPSINKIIDRKIIYKSIVDGSISDGEEKFHRSQDDESEKRTFMNIMETKNGSSGTTEMIKSTNGVDSNKVRARKCASSDTVTFLSHSTHPLSETVSFLSPVDSVPSDSDRNSSPINQNENQLELITNGQKTGKSISTVQRIKIESNTPDVLFGDQNGLRETPIIDTDDFPIDDHRSIPDSIFPNGKSWLLVASSSSEDVLRDKRVKDARNGHGENRKFGSRSTGDCFSSEDYFKFTLKRRLLQQCQHRVDLENENDPLLTLDRDIRNVLNTNIDDFNNNSSTIDSFSRQRQSRSSSPNALSSLMAAAQQRCKQQSERFTRPFERASFGAKFENQRQNDILLRKAQNGVEFIPPPKPYFPESSTKLSSSFSSSSSSSSSMSWMSQNASKHQNSKPIQPKVDINGEWTPNDPVNMPNDYEIPMSRNRCLTTSASMNSAFHNSQDAMRFLKQELASIRRKDHQILKQLTILDAEISRRKSETDALATIRSSSESEDLDNMEYVITGPTGPLVNGNSKSILDISRRLEDLRLSNAKSTVNADSNSNPPDNVPPLPRCLEISFKTL